MDVLPLYIIYIIEQVTFDHMPLNQKPHYRHKPPRPFKNEDPVKYIHIHIHSILYITVYNYGVSYISYIQ